MFHQEDTKEEDYITARRLWSLLISMKSCVKSDCNSTNTDVIPHSLASSKFCLLCASRTYAKHHTSECHSLSIYIHTSSEGERTLMCAHITLCEFIYMPHDICYKLVHTSYHLDMS